MKEFPRFVYNEKDYDLCFYDESVALYVVANKLSGIMVSQVIPAANDYVAMTGFSDFLAERETENDTQIYELIRIGSLDIQKQQIIECERVMLIDSREDVSNWLEEAKNFMISFNDEE